MITLLLTLTFATCVAVGFSLLLVWRERVKNRKREIERLRALERGRHRPLPQTQPDVYPYQRVVKARAAEDIPVGTVVSVPARTHQDDYTAGYYALMSLTEDAGPTREVLPAPVYDPPATAAEACSPSCDYSPSGDSCSSFDGGGSPGSDSSW